MSFEKLKRDALYELATENFAVEVPETATKPQIIAALVENGVDWEMAKTYDKNAAAVAAEEEDVEVVSQTPPGVITSAQVQIKEAPVVAVVEEPVIEVTVTPTAPVTPESVLLKMERENPRYEIRGYKFTQKDPFVLVQNDDADFILSNEEGFKMATPREAKEFYG
jgi:hypothetical protein